MMFSKTQSEAVLAGNKAPDFETLFQQHWTRVCSVLFQLVGDWAEAEDLALEVFWRLYRRPPKDSHSLGGWLYRVATNLGFNALRARKRRLQYEEQSGYLASEDDPHTDPVKEVERRQERERVRTALSRMKPRSAQLLILRYSGMSYREIAEGLGLAPASIGSLLARAEQEFESNFERQEGE